ncbi:unnamed protein product [Camellia sinensis]
MLVECESWNKKHFKYSMSSRGSSGPPLRGYVRNTRRRKMALDVDLNVPPSENLDQEGTSAQANSQDVQFGQQRPSVLPAPIDVEAFDDDVVISSRTAFAEAKINSGRGRNRGNTVVVDVDSAMEQSKANIANRERMYTKRRCGSRSIPVRVEKLAREKKMLPDLVELYKETHYNEKTHEWISSQAQCNYENMIQTQADHLSQPRSTPLTVEELSIKVLKPRSGYVKGLGMRSSSSIRRATTIYAETNDYVKRLEMQIETQKEQIQMQNNKIEDLEEGKKKQGEIMADVVNFLRTKGFTGHFVSGGDSSTSGHTS